MTGSVIYDVAICGYGPAGEYCANLLGQGGHRTLVLEKTGSEVYPLPRAVSMDAEVLRCSQLIQVADELAANMRPTPGAEFVTADGVRIMGSENRAETALGWAPAYLYHQPDLDRILRRKAAQRHSVEVHYESEVTAFTQTADFVELRVRGLDQPVRARYLLGCDGASSFVREHGDFGSESLGYDQDWLVVDLILEREVELPALVQQICAPERRVTFVPGIGRRVRWEFQLKEGESREQMENPEIVMGLLKPWIEPGQARIERARVYRFHAVLAKRWRTGRCFLLGDAAHQMPPFMGQGLCSGARDAFNLCWKLDLVLRDLSSESLLDSYEQERKPHAAETIEHAVMAGKLIDALAAAAEGGETGSPDPAPDLARSGYGGGRSAPSLTRGLLDLSTPSPFVGRPCPQPWVGQGILRTRLDDLLGPGFAIVSRDDPGAALSADSRSFWSALGGRLLGIPEGSCEPDRLAPLFESHQAIVVRPDRYIYATVPAGSRDALDLAVQALKSALT